MLIKSTLSRPLGNYSSPGPQSVQPDGSSSLRWDNVPHAIRYQPLLDGRWTITQTVINVSIQEKVVAVDNLFKVLFLFSIL